VPHDLASDTRGPSANHLLPGAGTIADELTAGQVRLNLGGSVYDPTEPVRRLMFNPLTMRLLAHGDDLDRRLWFRPGGRLSATARPGLDVTWSPVPQGVVYSS
jgi:hypothetical protein